MTDRAFRLLLAAVVILSMLGLAGCGCENEGDDDEGFTASSIVFTPDGPGGQGSIWLELEDASPGDNSFTLKVLGSGLEAYGVAGRLEFAADLCSLNAGRPGDGLEGGSAKVIGAAGANEAGGMFGFSRSEDITGSASLTPDKVVGFLDFSVSQAGSTKIEFSADRSYVMDEGLDKVEVGSWLGGTLIVE